jgi:acetolactate decarboxylase
MKAVLCAVLGLLFFAQAAGQSFPAVQVRGAMRYIMQEGNLRSHLRLDTVDRRHLYGLGPAAGLKGEIMILDGQAFVTSAMAGRVQTREESDLDAAMLVYAYVQHWSKYTLPDSIPDYATLQELVRKTAARHGISADSAFPFMLTAPSAEARYHVIDWREGVEHTMDNHKQFALRFGQDAGPIEALGFYSNHHQGVFTHHTAAIHVHMRDSSGVVGHLDGVRLPKGATIYLPKATR